MHKHNKLVTLLKNKNVLLGLSVILGIAAVIVIYNLIDIKEVLSLLRNTTITLILLYIATQVAMTLIVTWRWKVVLESQGIHHVSMKNLTKYVLVGRGVSFLTPSGKLGSEPVRAGLLSSKDNIKFDKALSSVVIDRSLDVSASIAFFVIGLFAMVFFFVVSPSFSDSLLVISAFLLIAIIIFNYRMLKGKKVFHHVFRFFHFHKVRKFEKFEKKLVAIEKLIIKFYHKDTKYFYQTLAISLLSWVFMFVEFKIAGLMIGENLSPVQSFIIFSFIGMAYILPVPMALGTLEASQISAFSIMGIRASAGLALSFLVRLKDFIISIIGVAILASYGVSVEKTVKETDYLDKEVAHLDKLEHSREHSKKAKK
jgi:glycosyltransferase 2 family protein